MTCKENVNKLRKELFMRSLFINIQGQQSLISLTQALWMLKQWLKHSAIWQQILFNLIII